MKIKTIAHILSLALLSGAALAEDYSTGERADWHVVLGGGLASAPRYEGSANNRLRVVPLINVQNGHFFAGTARGIGYDFSDNQQMQYGVRLTLAPYRRQNADVRLNGTGDIGSAAEAGAFFNAKFSPFYVNANVAGSSRGTRAEIGGGVEHMLSSNDHMRLGLDLNWANNKYMQTYFGISAAQALASGGVLAAYNASAGVKDYVLHANWTHHYDKTWFSTASLSVKQLAGSAQNSPITMKRTGSTLTLMVGYHF